MRSRPSLERWGSPSECALIPRSWSGCALTTSARSEPEPPPALCASHHGPRDLGGHGAFGEVSRRSKAAADFEFPPAHIFTRGVPEASHGLRIEIGDLRHPFRPSRHLQTHTVGLHDVA